MEFAGLSALYCSNAIIRDAKVPAVWISGNHEQIRKMALAAKVLWRTYQRRPELLQRVN